MTKVLKQYVDDCFIHAKAPKSRAVTMLKKEVYLRVVQSAKYFVRHGMSEDLAAQSAVKTVTNVRAMTAAAIREENRHNASHSMAKAVAIVIALVCFIMCFLPIVKFKDNMPIGLVISAGIVLIGIGFLVYASRSKAKPVDVEKICDRFEIGRTRHAAPTRRYEKQEIRREREEYRAPTKKSRMVVDETYETPTKSSVYSISSKLIGVVSIVLYIVCVLFSGAWLASLISFPLCFSLTRLIKACTDFFKGNEKEVDEA